MLLFCLGMLSVWLLMWFEHLSVSVVSMRTQVCAVEKLLRRRSQVTQTVEYMVCRLLHDKNLKIRIEQASPDQVWLAPYVVKDVQITYGCFIAAGPEKGVYLCTICDANRQTIAQVRVMVPETGVQGGVRELVQQGGQIHCNLV